MKRIGIILAVGLASAEAFVACTTTRPEAGFVSLFDGKTLNGWTMMNSRGGGYGVTNGTIFCAAGGGGNLLTQREFSDFILRLEFKLETGGNNGVGIRAPLEGQASSLGMEIQVLDDKAPKHATIQPWQRNGSVYGIIPATNGLA